MNLKEKAPSLSEFGGCLSGAPSEELFLEEVFFPFTEWMLKFVPLERGVLTCIRPYGSSPFFYHPSPFSGYRLIASFRDSQVPGEKILDEKRFYNAGIFSLVHLTTGFLLNLLVVESKGLEDYRAGLVLESSLKLSGNWWQNALYHLGEKDLIPRLFVAFHPHLIPEGWGGVILEAYRTLSQNQQVKFYFRWGGKV